ncbi:MAG: hypothetical protein ACE361_06910 [Aureliella sp.]
MENSTRNTAAGIGLQSKPRLSARRAATIIEVLFSIFVVVVGLMGIASLFPLAARNAAESNASNNALTQGRIWLNDFLARGFNDHNGNTEKGTGYNWLWRNDDPNLATSPLAAYSKLGPTGTGTPTPINSNPNYTNPNGVGVRTWQQQSVCIDPMFMSDPDVVVGFNTGTGRTAGFRPAVFPYYEDGMNPTEDAAGPAINPWHAQPRMLRLSLGGGAGQIPRKLVNDLFVSRDDLATQLSDNDDTIPTTRVFSSGGSKSLTTGDYSWMATLSPEFTSSPLAATDAYVLSLVIMQRRDRQFIGSTLNPVPGVEDSKPNGERLLWVMPLSGDFVGGTGGRVRLISNKHVEHRLHVGDWIMLGKHYAATSVTQRFSVFRWFRIVATDAERRLDLLQNVVPTNPLWVGTDPYGNSAGQEVWTRDVVLEGPDWSFAGVTNVGGTAIMTPTTGTLVDNVVTVIERTINVD